MFRHLEDARKTFLSLFMKNKSLGIVVKMNLLRDYGEREELWSENVFRKYHGTIISIWDEVCLFFETEISEETFTKCRTMSGDTPNRHAHPILVACYAHVATLSGRIRAVSHGNFRQFAKRSDARLRAVPRSRRTARRNTFSKRAASLKVPSNKPSKCLHELPTKFKGMKRSGNIFISRISYNEEIYVKVETDLRRRSLRLIFLLQSG